MIMLAAGLGVMLGGGLFVLFVLRRSTLSIQRVPVGEDWTTFYRRQQRERRKSKLSSGWIWYFLGAVAVLVALGALAAYFLG
jgi:hypothetical protein